MILACIVLAYIAYLWFTRFDIYGKDDGLLYLRRFHLVRLPKFKLFLHRIYKADADRHWHNHPWSRRAGSLILWGGYREFRTRATWPTHELWGGPVYQEHTVGSVMRLHSDDYHKIVSVKPNTWTLFFAGPRDREWGFLVDGKHVDWRKYLGLPEDADLGD